jgi:hypothetical protein
MHLSLSQHLLLLSAYSTLALAQGGADSDPYVPVYAECPSDLEIRPAKDVSPTRSHPSNILTESGLIR